jgi:hypothetical protein
MRPVSKIQKETPVIGPRACSNPARPYLKFDYISKTIFLLKVK